MFNATFVVLPGLEPGISGPESDVLPLHHRTESNCHFFDGAKVLFFFISPKY